jgi:hypothetical protein
VLEQRTLLSLTPSFQFVGKGNWSLDAVGSNNTPVGPIHAVVPPGSTVVKAFLYSTMYAQANLPPTVNFDGMVYSGSQWTALGFANSYLQAWRADVTAQVSAKIGSGSNSTTVFEINSENPNFFIDGEALAIVYSNPAEKLRTIALLDGAAQTTGDTAIFNFNSSLGNPNAAGFEAIMSLGIGFGYQTPGNLSQHSNVDVNGMRLTSSAGGQDDGLLSNGQKPTTAAQFSSIGNGGLITIGGYGDSPANPADPFYGANGSDPLGLGARADDELYDLRPFLKAGDTGIVINTLNPSNDDNIFFTGLNITAQGSATSITQAATRVAHEGTTVDVTVTGPSNGQNVTINASLTNNTKGSGDATLFAGSYASNPTGVSVGNSVSFFDLKVTGADPTDVMTANIYYPKNVTGQEETDLKLYFFDGTAWQAVLSSGGVQPIKNTTDNLDGTTSGGRFTVVFDNTSFPKITDINKTVFALSVFNPVVTPVEVSPPVASTSSTPTTSTNITLISNTQLSLALTTTGSNLLGIGEGGHALLNGPGATVVGNGPGQLIAASTGAAAGGGGDEDVDEALRRSIPALDLPPGSTLPSFILDLLTPKAQPKPQAPTKPADKPRTPVKPEEESRLDSVDAYYASQPDEDSLPAIQWDDTSFGTSERPPAADQDGGTGEPWLLALSMVGIGQWRPAIQRNERNRPRPCHVASPVARA